MIGRQRVAQTRRTGMQRERAWLPNAPRPPTQASARPSLKSMLTERRGRDVGFAESGFRPTAKEQITPYRPFAASPSRPYRTHPEKRLV